MQGMHLHAGPAGYPALVVLHHTRHLRLLRHHLPPHRGAPSACALGFLGTAHPSASDGQDTRGKTGYG